MPNNNEEILLVTSGYNDMLYYMQSFDRETERFADFPITIQRHCLIKISNSKILFIGGSRAGLLNLFEVTAHLASKIFSQHTKK